ncbi:hypothetical protein A9Q98_15175 [Thalassotalea sp. 42_200_T64]|nr:hypothetical protein A9Q98_15175 [Thalassotalea sp. 42_200_T64]
MPLRSVFSSLTLKVFLGFWIIAISAILVTRWVSLQFTEFNQVTALNENQQQQLTKTVSRINSLAKRQPGNVLRLIADKDRRLSRGIWLKSRANGKIITNSKYPHPEVLDNINAQKFTQPVALHLFGYQLIGPITITLNNRQYQLFTGKPVRPKDFAGMLKQMPFWLRIFTGLLVTALLSWLLSWYLIRPLKKLTRASEQFGSGDLSTRVPEFDHRFDEVGQLGQAFNSMAERLHASIAAQQRLLGDVSHELRSPLTRLQLALSLANKVEHKPVELEKYFQRFNIEIQRLDEMIAQALQLSRLENQLQQTHLQPVNFNELISNMIDDAEYVLKEKQVTVTFTNPTTINITADAQLLASAIENLFNNAIRFSPASAQIDISLALQNNTIVFSICDQGKGVAAEQLQKIFKPFYRTAQARDRVSGGTGLGLAIASRAVESHHGKIYAQAATADIENPGLKVTIELPYATR